MGLDRKITISLESPGVDVHEVILTHLDVSLQVLLEGGFLDSSFQLVVNLQLRRQTLNLVLQSEQEIKNTEEMSKIHDQGLNSSLLPLKFILKFNSTIN